MSATGTPNWFDLMTRDVERAKAFYGPIFGWTFDTGPAETGHYTMCGVGARKVAGIATLPEGNPMPSSWTVYFASENADRTAAMTKELGGKIMMEPMDVMEEGRMLIGSDPTGAVFGVWQPKKHTGTSPSPEHGSMAWCEVNTRDAAKARDFYGKLLGLRTEKMDAPDMTYYTLHHGQDAVAGVLQMDASMPAQTPPHWMPYFVVKSADAAAASVEKGGGKVHMKPFNTPYGRCAVFSDPWGATFSVMQANQ